MHIRFTILAILTVAPLAARSYPVDGSIVAVDPSTRTMLVSHRPIANYMGAMMMPFRVEDARDLAGLHPGSRVQFDLIVDKAPAVARRVRHSAAADVEIPAPPDRLRIGDPLP